jgi:hypothetical protein
MSSGKAWGVEPPDSLSAGKLTGNFRKFRPILTFWDGFGSRSPSGFSSLQSNSLLPGNRESFCPEQGFVRPNREFSGGSGGTSSCTAPSCTTPRPRLRVGRRTSAFHGVCKTSIMWKPDTTFRGVGPARPPMPCRMLAAPGVHRDRKAGDVGER